MIVRNTIVKVLLHFMIYMLISNIDNLTVNIVSITIFT